MMRWSGITGIGDQPLPPRHDLIAGCAGTWHGHLHVPIHPMARSPLRRRLHTGRLSQLARRRVSHGRLLRDPRQTVDRGALASLAGDARRPRTAIPSAPLPDLRDRPCDLEEAGLRLPPDESRHPRRGLAGTFFLARTTFASPRLGNAFGPDADVLAALVAALWAAHPLHTQAVTSIDQRCNTRMSFLK